VPHRLSQRARRAWIVALARGRARSRRGSPLRQLVRDARCGPRRPGPEAALDRFLADPLAVIPGTSMQFPDLKDPRERALLIAFLKRAEIAPPQPDE
jgi:hypothetical protein